MANIKSAKKRIKVTQKRTLRNKAVRTRTKNAIKKLIGVIGSGDAQAAKQEFPATAKAIDRAAAKGVIHKNNASRKISRLAKRINKMA